mmetsp:Transcript_29114/g.44441  ORF Transcript_29114/g.44441 Transcript_29114/m.44441 type:complete len:474 (+) Transcript_29114:86-1507(+)
MLSTRRVVVTGIGAITPLGNTFKTSWQNLTQHENPSSTTAVGATTLEEALVHQDLPSATLDHDMKLAKILPSQVAAPVRNIPFDARSARFVQFALHAGKEALDSAGLMGWLDLDTNTETKTKTNDNNVTLEESGGIVEDDVMNDRRARIGTCIASGMSSVREIYNTYHMVESQGSIRRINPHFVPKILCNAPSSRVSIAYNLQGPNLAPSTACAAAGHAIGDAMRCIQFDDADIMLAGGAEASIDPISMGGFSRLRALSTSFNDEPLAASRPFDKDRDGFVMGEGSCLLVLEELEHAKKRGANILAEICGYGLSGDAFHVTSPDPEGRGAERAMRMALDRAGMEAGMIDYVNAHATSTPMGDEIEEKTIGRVLAAGDDLIRSNSLYVSSTKGATGHLLGAAGAIESAFAVQAIVDGVIPATKNLSIEEEGQSGTFQHVSGKALKKKDIKIAMNNSFGFGGTNCCLIFSELKED